MVVPRLLIIVGTSGVGKSTMSAKLASELGFSKVASTDTVREVLRTQLTSSENHNCTGRHLSLLADRRLKTGRKRSKLFLREYRQSSREH